MAYPLLALTGAIQYTVIPAMVQRLFFDIIKQRDHKYATHSLAKQFYLFLATAPTGVLTADTTGLHYHTSIYLAKKER